MSTRFLERNRQRRKTVGIASGGQLASKAAALDCNALECCGRRVAIRAELAGSDTCSALGITCTAYAPVIALCRQLLEAGIDPDAPLAAYRGATLCLRVSAVGQAAQLTVKTAGNGCPIFARDSGAEGAAGPPTQKKRRRVRAGTSR